MALTASVCSVLLYEKVACREGPEASSPAACEVRQAGRHTACQLGSCMAQPCTAGTELQAGSIMLCRHMHGCCHQECSGKQTFRMHAAGLR